MLNKIKTLKNKLNKFFNIDNLTYDLFKNIFDFIILNYEYKWNYSCLKEIKKIFTFDEKYKS